MEWRRLYKVWVSVQVLANIPLSDSHFFQTSLSFIFLPPSSSFPIDALISIAYFIIIISSSGNFRLLHVCLPTLLQRVGQKIIASIAEPWRLKLSPKLKNLDDFQQSYLSSSMFVEFSISLCLNIFIS